MPSNINPIDPFLQYFTDREGERAHFRQVLGLREGEEVPLFAYHGVTGAGKTWLLRQFREIARTVGVPAYAVELDISKLGARIPDRAGLCAAMVSAFGLDAPRTMLALAYLLQKEVGAVVNRKELTREMTTQGVQSFVDSFQQGFQSFSLGGLFGAAFKAGWEVYGKQKDVLVRYLRTPCGFADKEWLERQDDSIAIRKTLFDRFAADLHATKRRPGFAVQAVLLVDSTEQAFEHHANAAERHDAIAWMTELMQCGLEMVSSIEVPRILVVPFGQNPLEWAKPWSGRIESHSLEGFLDADAREYAHRRGLQREVEIKQVLQESAESTDPLRHHVLSLGLAIDTILLESSTKQLNKAFLENENRWDQLVARFFRRISDEEALRIHRLAVTPAWDKAAFAWVYRAENDPDRLETEWKRFSQFSFFRKGQNEECSLHRIMRIATLRSLSDDRRSDIENEWKLYWRNRSQHPGDLPGKQYLWHAFQIDPRGYLIEWAATCEKLRVTGRMVSHAALVSALANVITRDDLNPNVYIAWANECQRSTVGDNQTNILRAIYALNSASRLCTKNENGNTWATIQNDLGIAYCHLSACSGMATIESAITAFEGALQVYTKKSNPTKWAAVQNNLGNAYWSLHLHDREGSLHKAIDAFKSSLTASGAKSSALARAGTLNNLGNTYMALQAGERAQNIEMAIELFNRSLKVRTIRNHPVEWAATQNNLGTAYSSRIIGNRETNITLAINAFRASLRVRTLEQFPLDWATTQNNLGIAYWKLGKSGHKHHLESSLLSFEAALKVFSELNQLWRYIDTAINYIHPLVECGRDQDVLTLAKSTIAIAFQMNHTQAFLLFSRLIQVGQKSESEHQT